MIHREAWHMEIASFDKEWSQAIEQAKRRNPSALRDLAKLSLRAGTKDPWPELSEADWDWLYPQLVEMIQQEDKYDRIPDWVGSKMWETAHRNKVLPNVSKWELSLAPREWKPKVTYSETYSLITQSSAEAGDDAESGWISQGEEDTVERLLDYLGREGYEVREDHWEAFDDYTSEPAPWPYHSWTNEEGNLDPVTGRRRSLFIDSPKEWIPKIQEWSRE